MVVSIDENAEWLAWGAARIPEFHGQPFADGSLAVGVKDDQGNRLGMVAFTNFDPHTRCIEVCAVGVDPRWVLCRKAIGMVFDHAFNRLGCVRVWSRTPRKNDRALRLVRAFGMKYEAILERQFGDDDAVISRIFPWEFYNSKVGMRYTKALSNGQ